MKNFIALLILIPIGLCAQKADSIPTQSKEKLIEAIRLDSRTSPSMGVVISKFNEDTVFTVVGGKRLERIILYKYGKCNYDSLARRLFAWKDCIDVSDSLASSVSYIYKLQSKKKVSKLRKMSTQKILDKYFDKNYIYKGRVKEEIYYAIMVVFWERNIVTFFDDESGVLIIDFATMNYVPGKYYESGERRLN
jgi:hypothetical protein